MFSELIYEEITKSYPSDHNFLMKLLLYIFKTDFKFITRKRKMTLIIVGISDKTHIFTFCSECAQIIYSATTEPSSLSNRRSVNLAINIKLRTTMANVERYVGFLCPWIQGWDKFFACQVAVTWLRIRDWICPKHTTICQYTGSKWKWTQSYFQHERRFIAWQLNNLSWNVNI